MKCHEDLEVWQKAVEMSVSVYGLTKTFPPDEKFGLVNQMRRAAVSVASNIAEGAARQSPKEFVQFLYIAAGSASELTTQLVISRRLAYGCGAPAEKLAMEIDEVARMLQGLIRSLRKRIRDSN